MRVGVVVADTRGIAAGPDRDRPYQKEFPVDLISYMKNVIAPWVKARINPESELGASLVEYALLVALIAVICIVGIGFLGRSANTKFTSVGSELS